MAIVNLGWASSYFWDGRATSLEEQILEPVSHPDELALPWDEAVQKLQNTPTSANDIDYPSLFNKAFATTVITPNLVTKAIAQSLRTMVSADSKFDQWRRGETYLTDDEFAGYEMFIREGGDPEVNLEEIVFTATAKPDCSSAITSSGIMDWTVSLQTTPV